MRKLIPFLLTAWPIAGALAQCPFVLNCPQGSPVVCDQSNNESTLWNDAPYTWSTALQTADLYEGAADFALKVRPCPGGGNVSVSYLLLLDLDNDNLRETAVTSDNFPPPGVVYFDNAFNPNYTGGDLLQFDKRNLPDSLKFRFALEITYSWDTLIAHLRMKTGDIFVSPRLPEGRHHLLWRVEQNGVVKYCEHSFRIKDCQPPDIECLTALTLELDASGKQIVSLDEVLLSAEDNLTPSFMLEPSMRKAGDGAGFPLDSAGQRVVSLTYNCAERGEQSVEVWVRDRLANISQCQTLVTVADPSGVCDIPPVLCARTFWGNDMVWPVRYKMLWVDTSQHLVTHVLPQNSSSCGVLTFVPPATAFSLVAECDTNPLNGLSTFDLLLISRHILGIQPFTQPWQWLAADANKSGSVTTFDVVELRKLILGIYDKLPNNTSWRFFPTDCDFPPNPFASLCLPQYSYNALSILDLPAEIPFHAVKTGDVNGSASPDAASAMGLAEARDEPARLVLPDWVLEAGETRDVSIRLSGLHTLSGFQFGLFCAPDAFIVEQVVPGWLTGLDEDAFAQPSPGILHCSWFSPTPQPVFPDDDVLVLRLTALRTARLSEHIALQQERLSAEAYHAADATRQIELFFEKEITAPEQGDAILLPQPNPTRGGASIGLHLQRPERVYLFITDAAGQTAFRQETMLESGAHWLDIPANSLPSEGIYWWRVGFGENYWVGKLVKY